MLHMEKLNQRSPVNNSFMRNVVKLQPGTAKHPFMCPVSLSARPVLIGQVQFTLRYTNMSVSRAQPCTSVCSVTGHDEGYI